MGPAEIREYCVLDDAGKGLLRAAMQQLHLSAPGYHRILKLACMIADLTLSETQGACLLAVRVLQCRHAGPIGPRIDLRAEGDREMAREVLFLVDDAVEGGYIARALGYSIYTEADSWEKLKTAIRDAVQCHFDEGEQPDLIRLHAVREEVVPA